ncbi:hypothetical protein HF690_06500 [Oleiagrimonas citrea]|uniref:Uncharacterized protein n=1 Tax=Oleiagrimonas citrea TaxID=1665687 RepID=A0A846ZLP5_9GAMM|nr:hypothetical protein [Oleiagrimonas citrea]NKZ38607.1 hypothetical protein [Oleiagrimonas citrea]
MVHRLIRRKRCPRRRDRQRGSAVIEYAIVVGILIFVLLVGTSGNPAPVTQLVDALRDAYTSFVYTLSISWF